MLARREKRIQVTMGVLRAVIAVIVFAAVFFLVDWMFMLHAIARALLLLTAVGGMAWLGREYLYKPIKTVHNEETTALKLEAQFPHLRDRLISIIQLTAVPAEQLDTPISPRLLQKLEEDTAGVSSTLDFSQVINWRFLKRLFIVAGVIFLGACLSTVSFPGHVKTVLKRMAFTNAKYPTKTTAKLVEAPTRMVLGDDWELRVELGGRIPSKVTARVRPTTGKGRWVTHTLKPQLGYEFGLTLEKVQQSFTFLVIAGDTRIPPTEVTVIPPVSVLDPVLNVAPPAYIKGKPRNDVSVHGSRVLDGAAVDLFVPCTKDIVEARLIPETGKPIPLTALKDRQGAAGRFILSTGSARPAGSDTNTPMRQAPTGLFGFTLKVKDIDGLENTEPLTTYTIKIVEDGRPSAMIASPKGERSCVRFAEWTVRYKISDDFGVDRAWLYWEILKAADKKKEAESGEELRGQISRRDLVVKKDLAIQQGTTTMSMRKAGTEAGDSVKAWVVAADGRVTGEVPVEYGFIPGVARSESVTFNIVDEAEKVKEVQDRITTIEENVADMRETQRRVKTSVGQIKERLK